MRLYSLIVTTVLSFAVVLPIQAENHSDKNNKEPHDKFSRQISFGDSLSDVGSYAVGTIAALGGGEFTVNGPGVQNWTGVMAAKFGLSEPCAAQTGLDGEASLGLKVMPPTNHQACTGYAQGGARITNPIGIGNKATGGANEILGFLTVPVVDQIQNHLNNNHGKFSDDEIVFVFAGANDIFFQLALLQAGAIDPNTAVSSIATAANELAISINTKIVGNGARHVVVLNVPDIAITPMGATFDPATRNFIDSMVKTFNVQLKVGVAANSHHVLYVDTYSESYSQYVNPGAYGLSNVTNTACDLTPAKNPFGSSLICSPYNLTAGDTSHYLFADMVHPTPFGYELIANLVSHEMENRGWRRHNKH